MRKNRNDDPDPTSKEYRDRYYAARWLAARTYCDFLGFWRACRHKPCRRARTCRGDYIDCIEARRNEFTARFDAARAHLQARMPQQLGTPERNAWATDFCTATWLKARTKAKS